MCLIIIKQNNTDLIDNNILQNAAVRNPHGLGVLWLDTGELYKTLDSFEAVELLGDTQRPFIAHLRYATVGEINEDNLHPVNVDGGWLFTNGTLPLGDEETSDTKVFASILRGLPLTKKLEVIQLAGEVRVCLYDNGKIHTHGQWHERDGVLYSKANCFGPLYEGLLHEYYAEEEDIYAAETPWWETEDVDREEEYDEFSWEGSDYVAVYGTLKRGRHNNGYLLSSQFVSKGTTVNKYRMEDRGIPYVFEGIPQNQVKVELWRVADSDKPGLDALEGHPHHYERKLVEIEAENGRKVTAWLYFGKVEPDMTRKSVVEF